MKRILTEQWMFGTLPILIAILGVAFAPECPGADLGGAVVRLKGDEIGTTFEAKLIDRFKIQIDFQGKSATAPQPICVELPNTGPHAWPSADVEVRDDRGEALMVRRPGIEWNKLEILVPTAKGTCFVQAVPAPGGSPSPTSEKDRAVADSASGVALTIAKWHDGRKAALSIRFDDSHPTHLDKAIPILRDYGFRGTFMINPGGRVPGSRWRSGVEERLADWEEVARRGDQELANHSAHHRGAKGDEDMEAEIGEAARAIWKLTPGKSKLMALNLGGGTTWETTRTLRYYLEKYHQFDASQNSTGMDDSYGDRVGNFRRMLEQHIERGLWMRIHYHAIGEGRGSSEANFRAALDIAKEHASDLWIAGMADIQKYQTERGASSLSIMRSEPGRVAFRLSCATVPALYDQPLTIEVTRSGPAESGTLSIRDERGKAVALRASQAGNRSVLRFDIPPTEAAYSIEMAR